MFIHVYVPIYTHIHVGRHLTAPWRHLFTASWMHALNTPHGSWGLSRAKSGKIVTSQIQRRNGPAPRVDFRKVQGLWSPGFCRVSLFWSLHICLPFVMIRFSCRLFLTEAITFLRLCTWAGLPAGRRARAACNFLNSVRIDSNAGGYWRMWFACLLW